MNFMERWRKFRQFSASERKMFLLAIGMLPLSSLAMRCFGFKASRKMLAKLTPEKAKSDSGGIMNGRAQSTARMVQAAAVHGVYHATCLPKSLTLWWLLRLQGISSDLHIGMQKENDEFKGHAWVECNGIVLNDQEDVSLRYVPFSSDRLTP